MIVAKLQHGSLKFAIKLSAKSDNVVNPGINYTDNAKTHINVDGSCLKQENVTFNQKAIINIFIFTWKEFMFTWSRQ